MSRRIRTLAVLLAFGLVAAGCEESDFLGSPGPVDDQSSATEPEPDGETETSTVGCGVEGFPGDRAFTEAVCAYQATLIRALAAGVDVSDEIDSVAEALILWITDPDGALALVEDAIGQIDAMIAPVTPDTSTMVDVTDNLFACVSDAADWLQIAFDRINIGRVVIPEIDDWQATFDQAAALAEEGRIAEAITVVCGLTDEMESVLVQS
jgi:hypothetical protein